MQNLHYITHITATKCCVCGKALTDAESIEQGIGPICSSRYYNPLHKPTAEMVQSALGHLMISKLPTHIIKGFLDLVKNDHINARKGCNLLIYWASCQYHDKEEVFKCSRIIRELGYTELADRLEIDRTVVSIQNDGDTLVIAVPNRRNFLRDLKRIPEAVDTKTKIGHKVIWNVPAEQRRFLDIVLGYHLDRKLACGLKSDGTTGVWTIPAKYYQHIQEVRETAYRTIKTAIAPTPQPTQQMLPNIVKKSNFISDNGSKLLIRTPYNAKYVTALKESIPYSSRKWNPNEKCWEVGKLYETIITGLLQSYFGTT